MLPVQIVLRRLRASPALSVAIALTLAITIGATGSVFGLVYGVLLKAFPYDNPDRVLTIWESNAERHLPRFTVSPADYVDWQARSRGFARLAAAQNASAAVGDAGSVESVTALLVTPSYFSVLGIPPVLGRPLSLDSTGPAEVVISHGYWQRRFGAVASALGQSLVIDGQPVTVVGVMPQGLPDGVDVWMRLTLSPDVLSHRDWHYLEAYGRLKAGVSARSAQEDLATIARQLAQAYPQTNETWSVVTIPLLDLLVGAVRPTLTLLFSAAASVLILGLVTLANLLMVRGLARERDVAIRTALGATRSRIVRDLFLEVGAIGLVAAALAIALASAGVRVLRALAPSDLPRLQQVTVGLPVIAFCATVTLAAVIAFGVVPAWRLPDGSMSELLREGGQGTGTLRRRRLQGSLLVLQVSAALVLLIGTGLLVKTLRLFWQTDPGFQARGVLTARISLPAPYDTLDRQDAFVANLTEQLSALPGVQAASLSSALPGGAAIRFAFTVSNEPTAPGHEPIARPVFITPEYLSTMGIRLRRGRGVLTTDDRHAQRVVVVDELLRQRVFGDESPIGRHLKLIGPDTDVVEVVGVVSHVNQGGLIAEDVPLLYLPLAQAPFSGLASDVAILVSDNANLDGATLHRVIAGIDPDISVYDAQPLLARMEQSVGTTRFAALLSSLFTIVAVALSVIGIYSALSFLVTQRRREIGVRLALGGTTQRVLGRVMSEVLALAALGLAIGTLGAWWLMQLMGQLLGRVSPHDPLVIAGALGVIGLAISAGASVPVLRAANVSPVEALRAN